MKKIILWNKVSNASTAVMIVALASKMFFRKYLEDVILPILIVGAIAFVVMLVAELMKYRLRRQK
jgi:hypothetical protein